MKIYRGKKSLVISNEEAASDVYNRIACLNKIANGEDYKKWNYQNHEHFTDEQRAYFANFILQSAPLLRVVDNSSDINGLTSSYEGITKLLTSLLDKKVYFDSIIIDYYQKVNVMESNPYMKDWEVQKKFVDFLDTFKNNYPSPIVLMGQLKPRSGETEEDFKNMIEGSKSIYNAATCCIHVKADKPNLQTEWTLKKNRFGDIGRSFRTAWHYGRYLSMSDAAKKMISDVKIEKAQQEVEQRKALQKGGL